MVEDVEKLKIEQRFPSWRELLKPVTEKDFKPGFYHYSALVRDVEGLELPFPREWNPLEKDWKLPPNWKEIFLN